MKKMAAGSFKVHCLAVMDEVQAKRETVVITKHGRPVAKLVPADKDQDEIYNYLRGKGAATDDVISPSESPSRRRASRTVSPDEVGQVDEGRKVKLTVKRVPEGKTWEGLPWI